MSRQGESASLYRANDRNTGANGQLSGATRRNPVGTPYSPNSRVPAGSGGNYAHGRQNRESFEDWEDVEGGTGSRSRTWLGGSTSSSYPIEVDWYQAPPIMYNLKLKMKVASAHESARLLPLTERPDLSASQGADSTSMAPLNGTYRRVSVTTPIKISGADFNRIKDSHLATRMDFCKFEGGTLLIALVTSSHKRASKSYIRYFSIDLDTVHMLPRVTRLQPGPIIPSKDTTTSTLTSSASTTSTKPTSSTKDPLKPTYSDTHSVSFLQAIIGDDYVSGARSGLTWQDAGHVPATDTSHLSASTPNGGYGYSKKGKEPELTEAQLLSASVVSRQTVVFNGTEMSRNRPAFEDSPSYGDVSGGHSPPPRQRKKPIPEAPPVSSTTAFIIAHTSTEPASSPKEQGSPHKIDEKREPSDLNGVEPTAPLEDAETSQQAVDLTASYAVASVPNGTSAHEEASQTDDQIETSSQNSNATSTMSTATPTSSAGNSAFHLNLTMGEAMQGMTHSDTTTPSGSGTPAPSTPTSTSSSYSMAAASLRDPSEGVEYMGKDIEQTFLTAEVTSLSINRATSTWNHFEMVIGFAGGQILRYDPKIPKTQGGKEKEKGQPHFKVHNDGASMIRGGVRKLAWINHNEFMASFPDGFLYLFHLHLDDDPDFAREDKDPRRKRMPHPNSHGPQASTSSSGGVGAGDKSVGQQSPNVSAVTGMSPPQSHTTAGASKSANGKPAASQASKPEKPKKAPKPAAVIDNIPIPADGWISETMWRRVHKQGSKLLNPIGLWSICPGSVITDFAVSSDLKSLATTSKDGILRIFSMATYELLTAFKSYFGGFTCLAWSPDDAYIVTGGEDDLVSLWSVAEKALVARGKGHTSWVSKVAFDPHRCSSRAYYRFASVGQDCQLAIWEFSSDTLVPPRQTRRRLSLSVSPANSLTYGGGGSSSSPSSSSASASSPYSSPISPTAPHVHVIPPAPRDSCFGLDPIAIQKATTSPCSEVQFLGADLLLVAGWAGQVAYFVLETGKSGTTTISNRIEMDRIAQILASMPASSASTANANAAASSSTTTTPLHSPQQRQRQEPSGIECLPIAPPEPHIDDYARNPLKHSVEISPPEERTFEPHTQPQTPVHHDPTAETSSASPNPPSPTTSLANGQDMPNPEPTTH